MPSARMVRRLPGEPARTTVTGSALRRELKALHELLRQEGTEAFRAAFKSRLAGEQLPIPLETARSVARLLKRLSEPKDAEVAAEVAVWLFSQRDLTIALQALTLTVRRLLQLGATETVLRLLDQQPEEAATALFLRSQLLIARGELWAGLQAIDRALAADLPEALRQVAEDQSRALRFHPLGPRHAGRASALAVIEPFASLDLLHPALEEAAQLRVCSTTLLDGNDRLQAAVAAGRLEPVPYQLYHEGETHAAALLFSSRLLRHATERLEELALLREAGAEELEGFRSALQLRFKGNLRFAHNALAALRSSDVQRIFLVAEAGWLVLPLALRLAEEGRHEIQIACGSRSPHNRRLFAEAFASPSLAQALQALMETGGEAADAPEGLEADSGEEDEATARSAAPSPWLIELSPLPPPREATRRCIICTSLRQLQGLKSLMPLQEIVARLLPEWDLLILVVGNPRLDARPVLDSLSQQLGALLPRVGIEQFSFRSGGGTSTRMPGVKRDVTALLREPDLREIAASGLALAPMLQQSSLGFFSELAQTAEAAPCFEELLRRWSPDVLLTEQHPALGWKFMSMAARRLGIPTLALQVLALSQDPWRPTLDADHFLSFDRYSGETMQTTTGFAPERITPIGSVRWDTLIRRARGFDRQTERSALDLGPDQQLVLVVTQPVEMKVNHELVDLTLAAVRDVPEARVIVKLHPRENDDRLAAIERQLARSPLASRSLVTRSQDTYRLMVAADLLVNIFSNVGIEAAILDLDVVAAEITADVSAFSLSELGLVATARDRETAIAQIRGLLLDPRQRDAARALRNAYFEQNPQLRDGRALDRLAAALAEAAANGRAGSWQEEMHRRPLGRTAGPGEE